jgi:hypothetical protein
MNRNEDRLLSLRCTRQTYIVFVVLLAPIFALMVFDVVARGVGVAILLAMSVGYGSIFFYFWSLKLALDNDRLVYRHMGRTQSVPVNDIHTISKGKGPFGAGLLWTIYALNNTPIVSNVTNFARHERQSFALELRKRNPNIQMDILPSRLR